MADKAFIMNGQIGIILANSGSPDAPSRREVRRYLGRFLMDDRIVPMNRLLWRLILETAILPGRSGSSARKYASIWTPDGSPLVATHEKLASALERALYDRGIADSRIAVAMSYGEPSFRSALRRLRAQGCRRLFVLPTYPQSAFCITGSVHDAFERAQDAERWDVPASFIDNYCVDEVYCRAIAASIEHEGYKRGSNDRVLFSFHSIPLSDVSAGDAYPDQVTATARSVANLLGVDDSRWGIAYSCVFGNKPERWLGPLSTDTLGRWGEQGGGTVYFVCPGFAVDCLETLYDIPMEIAPAFYEGKKRFWGPTASEGGFVAVPCLNATKAHLEVLIHVIQSCLV